MTYVNIPKVENDLKSNNLSSYRAMLVNCHIPEGQQMVGKGSRRLNTTYFSSN